MLIRTIATLTGALVLIATSAQAQQLRPVSDTTTTASGLRYVFLKRGTGPRPRAGDVIVVHGIGRLTDGTEFWNTRTDNEPFAYTAGVDGVIRGFEEGMKYVRQGDRIEIHMKPELAYGTRGSNGIPPNAALIFDYEVLTVYSLSLTNLLRPGLGNIDSTLAAVRALPNLKDYYVSEASLQSDANRAAWSDPANREKVLKFGISLMPDSYRLYQSLARAQAQRAAVAEAITSYEAALRLNPRRTAAQQTDHTNTTNALAELRTRREL